MNKTGELQAYLITSTIASGKIKSIDLEKAKNFPDVVAIFTAQDVPGDNKWGMFLFFFFLKNKNKHE